MNDQLINVPLWDQARWTGVGFAYDSVRIPFVALVFTDGAAGVQIFNAWRRTLGEVDEYDALRVAFIEGDIPGKAPGYTVYIGTNHEALVKVAAAAAHPPPSALFVVSRIHRMPMPNASHLAGFKREFARQRQYLLTAARLSASGELLLARDASIRKTDVVLKHVSDIGLDDVDRAIFVRDDTGPTH